MSMNICVDQPLKLRSSRKPRKQDAVIIEAFIEAKTILENNKLSSSVAREQALTVMSRAARALLSANTPAAEVK